MANFGNLPAEVRNAIYGQLFSGDGEPRDRPRNELAMLTVSKQFHDESSSYFYENHDLILYTPSLPTATATKLPPMADRYLRFLKRLTVHIPAGPAADLEMPYIASTIKAIPTIGAELTELKLVLTSNVSRYLNSRVDDSVLDHAHPVTNAIRDVLRTNVAKIVRITLKNAWFADGVAHTLQHEFGSKVEFYQDDMPAQFVAAVERAIIGRYASQHLTNIGLAKEGVVDLSRKRGAHPDYLALSSLPSSLCSALSELDMFSVSSFDSGADDTEAPGYNDSSTTDTSNEPFFAEDDIEEWAANDCSTGEDDFEMDLDEELEDVTKHDVDAFMHNMGEVAQHKATEEDIEYLTTFAPELLLSKAQLGHLIF